KFAISFKDFAVKEKLDDSQLAELIAANFELANFEFIRYKTKPKEGWNFVEQIIVTGAVSVAAKKGFVRGQTIGRQVNECRELANTPGGEMTPQLLAAAAKKAARNTVIRVRVLQTGEMSRLKMGGILGVSKGSSEKPCFIIMEYKKGGKEKPIVLVGKGVTFDSGGINIKPEAGMNEMHMDMSGGAAVIHAIALAARLRLKKNVIALIPAVENMVSGSSYRPGDILRSMSGKTIEVQNTDAEGRIILADGLHYAKRYDPKIVIDVATLTGAAVVALGQRCTALFTRDEKFERLFRSAGEQVGDYAWPLPLWDEYEQEIKGTFGDVTNLGKTRYGGAITAAMFLYQFIKGTPWVHLDIAPRMTATDGEYLAKGAAGAPVQLLLEVIERL
ncbi:MAG: hypothetical protein A2840_01880, partial [Candidatus Buchananbacteria bacterium RIFCSPHIGHO2_01_FULL_47_11b]